MTEPIDLMSCLQAAADEMQASIDCRLAPSKPSSNDVCTYEISFSRFTINLGCSADGSAVNFELHIEKHEVEFRLNGISHAIRDPAPETDDLVMMKLARLLFDASKQRRAIAPPDLPAPPHYLLVTPRVTPPPADCPS